MPADPNNLETSETGFSLISLRTLGWLLAGVAALATLTGLFFLEEDWRGKRAWENYRQGAEARGVVFDFDKFVPAPVPDDQNFTMTPFLAPMFDLNPRPLRPGQSNWRDTNGYNRIQNFGINAFKWGVTTNRALSVIGNGHLTDFDELARNLWKQNKLSGTPPTGVAAARAVLDNLKQYQPVLDELRTASHRPYARFNVAYDAEDPAAILLPHLAQIKRFTIVLQIKASAELALGKTDEAFEDLKLMLYLTGTLRAEPFIITHLVRFATLGISRQVVWEGLAQGRWSDAQLREIQASFQALDLMKDARHSLEGERAAFGTKMFDYLRKYRREAKDIINEDGSGAGNFFSIAPDGWLYLEQTSYQRAFDQTILPGFEPEAGRVHPKEVDRNFAPYKAARQSEGDNATARTFLSHFFHHDLLATLLLPSPSNYYRKTAVTQTAVNETVIACALERYRLANGKLPAALDAMAPQFLDKVPPDICTGAPLIYRPGNGNQFVLYSVGWNGTDEGGTTVMLGGGSSPLSDASQGDWVWPEYPAK